MIDSSRPHSEPWTWLLLPGAKTLSNELLSHPTLAGLYALNDGLVLLRVRCSPRDNETAHSSGRAEFRRLLLERMARDRSRYGLASRSQQYLARPIRLASCLRLLRLSVTPSLPPVSAWCSVLSTPVPSLQLRGVEQRHFHRISHAPLLLDQTRRYPLRYRPPASSSFA